MHVLSNFCIAFEYKVLSTILQSIWVGKFLHYSNKIKIVIFFIFVVLRFRCLAINNNITQAAETFLMIDMFCKLCLVSSQHRYRSNVSVPPLAVRISSQGGPFAAGKDYYVRYGGRLRWRVFAPFFSNTNKILIFAHDLGESFTERKFYSFFSFQF